MLKYVTPPPFSTKTDFWPGAMAAVYPPFSNDQLSISRVAIKGLSGVVYQRTWLRLIKQ